MPLFTAVLAAALFSGPAAVPPDPAPSGTRATDKNNAAPAYPGRPQLAPLPATAPQPGEFPFSPPQAPPWMSPSGMENRRNDTGSPAGANTPNASGEDAGRPAETAGDRAAGTETSVVPVIDPKTRDVFIQPVYASGKPAEQPRPFTFRPLQGVQTSRSYPVHRMPQKTAQQKAAQQKTAPRKTVTHPREHQQVHGW